MTRTRADVPAPDWSWLAAWPDTYPTAGEAIKVGGMFVQVKYDFALTVYGRPAPQGSKRHVGKGRMVEQSPHLPSWREAVRSEGVAESERAGLDFGMRFAGPVAVRMVFTLAAPQRARPGDRPAVAPDVSKLVRSTEDGLQDAGVIRNDALIVEYDRVAKVYPRWDPESLDRPGAIIKIRRLT